MIDILCDHFWACWWLVFVGGWGVLELIELTIKTKCRCRRCHARKVLP